jgi:fructose-bisphosphate aldolase class II
MPLVDMHDMLNHAYRNHYAVGGFGLVSLDFIAAIVTAAERCRSPVILSVAESDFAPDALAPAVAAAERAAQRASVPVALHFDRARSPEAAVRAINLGCNGVMVGAAHESFPANVSISRSMTELAHACGVTVEGDLSQDGVVEGEHADKSRSESVYTAVEEAKAYVQRTRVDCLVVSIGTQPGRPRGRSRLDIERLKRLNEAVRIPLVIRAASGLSDEQVHKLIQHGVAKINCSSALAEAAGDCIRTGVRNSARVDYAEHVHGVRAAIAAEVEHCMRRWGSAGRAAEVLVQCRAWQPVEHVIIYNVEGADDTQVEAMMARGRDVLSRIPGVRRVLAGRAMAEKPKYRFCWLVEFVHEKVIASYREHPEHLAFANELFRPVAGDRISIDFAEVSSLPQTMTAIIGKRANA